MIRASRFPAPTASTAVARPAARRLGSSGRRPPVPVSALDVRQVLALQRAAGNAAVATVLRQKAGAGAGAAAAAGATPLRDAIVIWFDRGSADLRKDANTTRLVDDTIAAARKRLDREPDARIVIAGYASEEGSPHFNQQLSERRAWTVKRALEAAGIAEEHLVDDGRGTSHSWPDRASNRRVEVEVSVESDSDSPPKAPEKRRMTDEERALLQRLDHLANFVGSPTPDALAFAMAVKAFESTLRGRIQAVDAGKDPPEGARIALEALTLWDHDTGTLWGRAKSNHRMNLSAPQYATVAAHMNKCNIFVAEVLHQTVGTVQQVYESDSQPGRYFPYRAEDWGERSKTIPDYPVVTDPQMGDIWSNGEHVGIYLGSYEGQRLYVSARNDTANVFGLGELQHEHGLQIKALPPGGLMRRHVAGH